jgi:hypothetical protein
MCRQALIATGFLACGAVLALAQTTRCGFDAGATCSATTGETATPSLPASLVSAVAASNPAVQAELARALAIAQQAMIDAAQASTQLQADIAEIQGRWARIQADATQGQGDAPAPQEQLPAAEFRQ